MGNDHPILDHGQGLAHIIWNVLQGAEHDKLDACLQARKMPAQREISALWEAQPMIGLSPPFPVTYDQLSQLGCQNPACDTPLLGTFVLTSLAALMAFLPCCNSV